MKIEGYNIRALKQKKKSKSICNNLAFFFFEFF